MSETDTAYTVLRDDYTTPSRQPLSVTTCNPGSPADPEPVDHGGGVFTTWFVAWLDLASFCGFLVSRCPHWRGGFWPSPIERGYRVVELEFTAPDDVAGTILNLSVFPGNENQVVIDAADVIAEVSAEDIFELVPPSDQVVNYHGARNSMRELMG